MGRFCLAGTLVHPGKHRTGSHDCGAVAHRQLRGWLWCDVPWQEVVSCLSIGWPFLEEGVMPRIRRTTWKDCLVGSLASLHPERCPQSCSDNLRIFTEAEGIPNYIVHKAWTCHCTWLTKSKRPQDCLNPDSPIWTAISPLEGGDMKPCM